MSYEEVELIFKSSLSEDDLLSALVVPYRIRSDGISKGEIWDEALREAERSGLAVWDALGWLGRNLGECVVDHEEFMAARDVMLQASAAMQAKWLVRWKRPEVWLAGIGRGLEPEKLFELLLALGGENSAVEKELLGALLFRLLESADLLAYSDDRKQRNRGRSEEEVPWVDGEWSVLSDKCASELLNNQEFGVDLAVEMLILCGIRRNLPMHETVAWRWETALSYHMPDCGFDQLMQWVKGSYGNFVFSALEGASIVAVCQVDRQVEWASRVLDQYDALNVSIWEGWGMSVDAADIRRFLPNLLGACLGLQEDPVGRWRRIWGNRYPGVPEGWSVDIANWKELSVSTAHWELVGLYGCLSSPEAAGGVGIQNTRLYDEVKRAIHYRLIDAAGEYESVDGYVLNLLWAIGGKDAIEASARALKDRWVAVQIDKFDEKYVSFSRLDDR